jgi:hypothetical protein
MEDARRSRCVGSPEQAAGEQVVRRILAIAVAAVAVVQGGCLVVAAGVAGGAAAAGYCYYKGRVCQEYPASLADTLAAVRTSLAELQFPITKEETKSESAYVTSRTADGSKVSIELDLVPSRVPADGTLTRVGIRVGLAFGDEAVSKRILDQVSLHLVPGPMVPAAPAPAPVLPPPVQRTGFVPGETAPPPLAPPLPGSGK